MSKRVGKGGAFLGLAELLLVISLGLCPREIPRSSPDSSQKTQSFPTLLLRLTQSLQTKIPIIDRPSLAGVFPHKAL